MLKVGITGGIGSGKTTVARIFELLNIPVYYADERAKALMVENQNLVQQIKYIFGDQAYLKDQTLNRKHIAAIAFNDKSKLALLNALVHPAVFEDSAKWHIQHSETPYTLKEAALLFESGSYKHLDKIITVFAPKELRLQRVINRDQSDRKAVEARMNKQMQDEEKMRLADFIIYNDGSISLIQQVFKIHQELIEFTV